MKDVVRSAGFVAIDRLSSLGAVVGWVVVFLMVGGMLAVPLSAVGNNDVPSAVRIAVLVVWGTALAIGLRYVSEHGLRTRGLEYLMRDGDYGWLSPILLSLIVFLFSVSGISALTVQLQDWGAVDLAHRTCPRCPLVFDDYMTFYTWHFLNAIPLLEVNETLHWEQPLVYRSALVAWLILALKVAVILPLVQLMRSYWRFRSEVPRVRIDAWPRVVRQGKPVRVRWASVPAPDGFVFDVYLEPPAGVDPGALESSRRQAAAAEPSTGQPGEDADERERKEQAMTDALVRQPGWRLWREAVTAATASFDPPAPGRWRFQVRWRRETEPRVRASNTPRTLRVTVLAPAASAVPAGASTAAASA